MFIRGVVIGLVVGGVAAAWHSPRSGRETRQLIRQRALGLLERVQGESAEDSIEAGKSIAHQHQAQLAERVN